MIRNGEKEGRREGEREGGREGGRTSRSSSISLGKKTRFVSARLLLLLFVGVDELGRK